MHTALLYTAIHALLAVGILFQLRRIRPLRPAPSSHTQQEPLVSVLIPARNEEHRILPLLESLKAQSYPTFEVLIWDDGSSDNTQGVVLNFAAHWPRVRIIPGAARPLSWTSAKTWGLHELVRSHVSPASEAFLFLDADTRVLERDFLSRTVAALQDVEVVSGVPLYRGFGESLYRVCAHFGLFLLNFKRSAIFNVFFAIRRKTYARWLPHERFKDEHLDEIAIGFFLAKIGVTFEMAELTRSLEIRHSEDLRGALNTLTRTIARLGGPRGTPFFLLLLLWGYVAPLMLGVWQHLPFQILGKWMSDRKQRASILETALWPVLSGVFILILWVSWTSLWFGLNRWRGRSLAR